jgi:uncharacterized membrane protein
LSFGQVEGYALSVLGIFHTGCGVLALVLGGWIFLARKGTRAHIRVGWSYVASMAFLNGTALALHNLTGGFNIFHALAVFSLATVVAGVIQVLGRRRWRRWLWRHYQYMAWSYVGLLAATINEGFVRVPVLQQLAASTTAPLPLLVMAGVVVACGVLIFASQRRILRRYSGVAEPGAAPDRGGVP